MKKKAADYLDRLFKANDAAELAEEIEDRQRLAALYRQLEAAGNDFAKVRRIVAAIRAEVKFQDWQATELSGLEKNVLMAHTYLCEKLGRLPSVREVHVSVCEKWVSSDHEEWSIRKVIKRLRLPIAAIKRGPRQR